MVWTLIYNGKLAHQIARLAAIVVKMAFHVSVLVLLISHIVGKLTLQDAFICLHVFSNYCQLSGSKIWFPLYNPWFPLFFSALFPVRSSESMFTQIQKNFVLHSLRSLPAKPVCQVGIPFAGRFIPRVANLSLE